MEMFKIEGEPEIVTSTREKILNEFGDLEFHEEGHKYFLHGHEIKNSVSSIGYRFVSDPFDELTQAEYYAKKNGNTPSFWIQQWQQNNFKATTLGTKTHEYGESLAYLRAGHPEFIRDSVKNQYMGKYNFLAPIHPKEEAAKKFLDELPHSMHLVLNEAKVYSGKNPDPSRNLKEQICGTFDMLYYFDGNGNKSKPGFVILDYKTNTSLTNEYNQMHNRNLLAPFDNLVDEEKSLYTIQLSLYSLMLEDIGINIIARGLIWLTQDGNYQKIPVKDVSETLRHIL